MSPLVETEIAVARLHVQAVFFHVFVVAVQQEMYILPATRKFCAIIPSDGAGADD